MVKISVILFTNIEFFRFNMYANYCKKPKRLMDHIIIGIVIKTLYFRSMI